MVRRQPDAGGLTTKRIYTRYPADMGVAMHRQPAADNLVMGTLTRYGNHNRNAGGHQRTGPEDAGPGGELTSISPGRSG